MTLKQWSEELGCKYGLLASRWKKGLRDEQLFAPPHRVRGVLVEFNGVSKPLRVWAKETGVAYETLYWRHKHGKDLL